MSCASLNWFASALARPPRGLSRLVPASSPLARPPLGCVLLVPGHGLTARHLRRARGRGGEFLLSRHRGTSLPPAALPSQKPRCRRSCRGRGVIAAAEWALPSRHRGLILWWGSLRQRALSYGRERRPCDGRRGSVGVHPLAPRLPCLAELALALSGRLAISYCHWAEAHWAEAPRRHWAEASPICDIILSLGRSPLGRSPAASLGRSLAPPRGRM